MIKIVIGLVIGVILTGALFMGPLAEIPSRAEADNSSPQEVPADIAEVYRESLLSPLRNAGDEITDRENSQFYHKLMQKYELDEIANETTGTDSDTLNNLMPDIEKIHNAATILPLQEAGKNIQDEEIRQFYYELLEDAGWDLDQSD